MTRKDVAWWMTVIFLTAEITVIAAYPDDALAIVRKVYLTCWDLMPVPDGVDRPTYRGEQ